MIFFVDCTNLIWLFLMSSLCRIDVGKRKKYVMVTTKRDGTKVKEYLDPEDPRISEIGVTRKLKPSSVDSDNTLQRKSDANEPYKNMRITLSGGPSVTRNLKDIAEDQISAANKVSRGKLTSIKSYPYWGIW